MKRIRLKNKIVCGLSLVILSCFIFLPFRLTKIEERPKTGWDHVFPVMMT